VLSSFIIIVQSFFNPNLPWAEGALIGTIIQYAIPVIIVLCQIFFGIHLAKHFKKKAANTTLWIALLFTVITSIFSLLTRISTIILNSLGVKGQIPLANNTLWIIVVAMIIALLTLKVKKSNQTGHLDMLEKENICLATGILVAVQGLIGLLSSLPGYVLLLLTFSKTPGMGELIRMTTIRASISVVIILFQIFLGVYLAKYYKKSRG
jgi:hypothetical protein